MFSFLSATKYLSFIQNLLIEDSLCRLVYISHGDHDIVQKNDLAMVAILAGDGDADVVVVVLLLIPTGSSTIIDVLYLRLTAI